ncbi:MAG: HNH endonuclease [Candidatus Thorarchaeota archaeon]
MVFKKGYKPTEEQKRKQSETRKRLILEGKIDMKKRMANPEIRKKISKTLTGKKHSKQRRQNISKAVKQSYTNGRKKCDGKVSKGKQERMMYEGKRIYVSHYVWFQNTGSFPKKGEVIHHKDFNQSNNSFDNLQLMSRKEHIKLHTEIRKNGIN